MLIDLTPVHAYVCVDNATSPVALPVSFSKLARTSHGLITFNIELHIQWHEAISGKFLRS